MILPIVVVLGFVVTAIALKLLWDEISKVKKRIRTDAGSGYNRPRTQNWGASNQLNELKDKVESLRVKVRELEEAKSHHSRGRSDRTFDRRTSKGGRVFEWETAGNRGSSSRDESTSSWGPESLTRDYNSLLSKKFDQGEFENRYSPLLFGVKNSEERFRNSGIEPVFGEKRDGRYWAIQADNHYLVVPIPMTIRGGDLKEGALDQLFDCEKLPERGRYKVRSLGQPAVFERGGFDEWQLVEGGQLDLEKYA